MAGHLSDIVGNLKHIPKKYWLLYLLIFASGGALRAHTTLNHDVAWLSVAAGRMLAGGSYRSDFFEINMPLAIAAYAPARVLANLTGSSLSLAVWVWVFILIFHSGLLVGLLRFAPPQVHEVRTSKPIWLLGLLTSIIFVPAYHFGQKEHLIAILITPFLVLVCQQPAEQNRPLRIYITATATLGFILKPHFVVLPLVLLGYRAYLQKSMNAFRSIEAAVLILVAIGVGALGWFAFPDWIDCAAWAFDLYGAYRRESTLEALSILPVSLFLLSALPLMFFAISIRSVLADTWALLLVAGYGLVIFAVQRTGWEYQFLPVSISLFLAQFVAYSHYREILVRFGANGKFFAILGLLISSLLVLRVAHENLSLPKWDRLLNEEIGQALSIAPPGTTVYIMTTTIVPGFPTVVQLNLEWGSRFPTLWPLAGLEWRRQTESDLESTARDKYSSELVSMVIQDFNRFSPSIVLVDRKAGQFGLPKDYDILEFFLSDSIFGQLWASYAQIGESSRYRIFVRNN